MKYEDAVKLEELAGEVFDAKQAVEMHRMRNIAGLTAEEQKKAFIELQMARARYDLADGKLQRARGQICTYGYLREGD